MKNPSIKNFRRTLRIISGILIVFFLLMFIGESLDSDPMGTESILQLSVMGVILIGLGLAWKWELTGGIIALAAFIGLSIINPKVLHFPMLYLYPGTAISFIVFWVISRNSTTKNE